MNEPSHEQKLIYDLAVHEDDMYYQRGNFFLVAEGMVLVAYSILAVRKVWLQSLVVAIFGLILTLVWIYAAHRSYKYFDYLNKRAEEEYPAYGKIREKSPKPFTLRVRPFKDKSLRAWSLMTYVVPVAAGLMWIVFLSS